MGLGTDSARQINKDPVIGTDGSSSARRTRGGACGGRQQTNVAQGRQGRGQGRKGTVLKTSQRLGDLAWEWAGPRQPQFPGLYNGTVTVRLPRGAAGTQGVGAMPATWHAQGETSDDSCAWCLTFVTSLSVTSTSATRPRTPAIPGQRRASPTPSGSQVCELKKLPGSLFQVLMMFLPSSDAREPHTEVAVPLNPSRRS